MKNARIVIEQVEPRVMMSIAPIAHQNPPPILWKNYDDTDKPSTTKPRPHTPPPVSSPVQPPVQPVLPPISAVVAPSAPKYFRARPWPKQNAIALAWKKVNSAADTVVVEYSTDGQNYTMLAMVDAARFKYCATGLDKTKTYHFRLYALVGNVGSAYSDEVKVDWACKKN